MNALQNPFAIIFVFGLCLWAITLFGGAIFGIYHPESNHSIPRRNRMTSSFILVLLAWIITITQPDQTTQLYFLLIALGMSAGFVGDLFMAELIPISDNTLGGIVAFGIGHIAYIIGIIHIGNILKLSNTNLQIIALIIWLIIGALGWFICVFWRNERTTLHLLALPYSLLLASTAGFFMGLALQNSVFWLPSIGAFLFLLSDLILSLELFRNFKPYRLGDIVWLTYGPGQMLIVCGVMITLLLR